MKKQDKSTSALQEQGFKAKFVTLFESHPDAVYIQTPDGRIIDCNSTATAMTGYSPDELFRLEVKDLFQDDVVTRIPSILKGEDTESGFVMDSICRKKSGDTFPVTIDLRLFKANETSYVFIIAHDMTTRKKSEDDIEKLKRQLQQAQKMEIIGQLAGGISHYYNNIFTGIIGALGTAWRNVPPDILPVLKKAEKMANLASGFTRKILTFSRESGIVAEPVDVGAIIDDAEEFAHATFERHIHIDVKKSEPLNIVLADPPSLHHMLLNLLVNARDALHEKQESVTWAPKLSITVKADNIQIDEEYVQTHSGARKGDFVRVSVSDTGCGMDRETQNRVFEPFFTTKEEGKGTGLGLATADSTVKEFGGWFELESKPGKGSTFTFYLPVTTLKRKGAPHRDTKDLPCGTEVVLFVDDDEIIRSLGTLMLERQGYTVYTAANGGECIECFMKERNNINLLVLDLGLPDIQGLEVLEKVRHIKPDIPVIIFTGHDLKNEREVFAELRADDYILKPFDVTDLVVAVRNVLNKGTGKKNYT
ncbi:response regulator [Candidatus Latescibacterota bacterium]